MGPEGLKGLPFLGGLYDLPEADRNRWLEANKGRLDALGITNPDTYRKQADRAYRNDLFRERFIKENKDDALLKSMSASQRDALYRETIINDAFIEKYSPYTEELDALGNNIVDSKKGMGNPEDFQKYMSMDSDSKLKLLESGWKTPYEFEKYQIDKEEEMIKLAKEADKAKVPSLSATANIANTRTPGQQLLDSYYKTKDTTVEMDKIRNDNLLADIYAKDLKKKEQEAASEINDFYENEISKLSDDEVKNAFMKAITPSLGNLGNGQFKAYFNEDGTVRKELEDFGIDNMRMYLSQYAVLTEKLGEGAAHDALINIAKEYINEQHTGMQYTGKLIKDIGIGALSYTADKINSLRQLAYTITGKDSEVYITNNGEVVNPDLVYSTLDGKTYYDNPKGERVPVQLTTISTANLDFMGKDAEGRDRKDFFNSQYWSDAEQYGTLDKDLINQYKQLGFSPYKVVYEPGKESDLLYETLKMNSFVMADAASTLIPVWGQSLGTAMQLAKGANVMAKTMRGLGTATYYASLAAQKAQPALSGIGIGLTEGRSAYGEFFAQNMQQLEGAAYNQAKENLTNKYSTDTQFKDLLDEEIDARFHYLKGVAEEQSSISIEDDYIFSKAKEQVLEKYIKDEYNNIRNSSDYYKSVAEATESAGDAALTTAVTMGAKEMLLNYYGYRKFLFKTPAQRDKEAAEAFTEGVTEAAKRLNFTSKIEGNKAKTIGRIVAGQGWEGAWTEFVDEMQVAAGREINEDRFSNYLKGKYDEEAEVEMYNAINAVNSYFSGAKEAVAHESTWESGLAGLTGSLFSLAPNITSITTTVLTNEGRKAWSEASFGEKVNMLISNGVLSDYYAEKHGEKQLKSTIDLVNKILDEQEDFEVIRDAVSLDMASADITNEEDSKTAAFLKALNSISILKQFEGNSDLAKAGSKSSIIQNALSDINNIIEGNLSNEQLGNYLSEFYASNPTIPQSEENNYNAIESIKNNAGQLSEAYEIWQDIDTKLSKVEKDRGSRISPRVRKTLLRSMALDTFLEDRMKELEKSISGTSAIGFGDDKSYGTKESKQRYVKAYNHTIFNLSKKIEQAEKALDKSREELKSFTKQNNTTNEVNSLMYTFLSDKVESDKIQVEYLEGLRKGILATIAELEGSQDSNVVLSKEEILSLNPEDRARMLDENNYEDYSQEQQAEIDKLKAELAIKDPSLIKNIQNSARLHSQHKANRKAYYRILSNPEAAYVSVEQAQNLARAKAGEILLRKRAEAIDNVLSKLESSLTDRDAEEVRDAVYKNLRVLSPTELNYLKEIDYFGSGLENIPRYANEIDKALNWSLLLNDIKGAVQNLELEEAEKKLLLNNTESLIQEATSREEAIQIIKEVIDSEGVSEKDKNKFIEVLKVIDRVLEQRNSTVEETKEDKKARESKSDKEQHDQQVIITQAEEQAKIDYEQSLTEEDNKKADKQIKEAEKQIEKGLEEAEDINLESPTIEQQVTESTSDKVNIMDSSSITESDNKSESKGLLGNTMYGYSINDLVNDAKEVKRTGMNPNDTMSRFFRWLDNNNINLQDIVDNELSDIIKVNPKLRVVYINANRENTTDDAALGDFAMLAVEYNEATAKLHKEERGGVITTKEGQYLIVGTLGFPKGDSGATYRELRARHRTPRLKYFNENPTERFFVVPNEYTKVKKITPGWLVRQKEGDEAVSVRSVSELLNDQQRNPEGLQIEDLKWAIQYLSKIATVGLNEHEQIYKPKNAVTNSGNTFLLVKATNGNYIPAYIIPVLYNDIKDGTLKDNIKTIISNLASRDYRERLRNIKQLARLLVLNKESNNILIGEEDSNTVSTVRNGTVLRKFNLEDPNFNMMDFFSAIEELNPRINITISSLSTETSLKNLDEAGALNIDIAKLSASNASYSVYAIGTDGTPIIEDSKEIKSHESFNDSSLKENKAKTIPFEGKLYRKKGDKWYNEKWEEVTEEKLITQLYYNEIIFDSNHSPDASNDKGDYYILNEDRNKPLVVLRDPRNYTIKKVFSKEDAITIIDFVAKKKEEEAKKRRAEEKLKILKQAQEDQSLINLQDAEDIVLDDEDIANQAKGVFERKPIKQVSLAEKIVDEIISDSHEINLSSDGSVYIDSTGKEYARVTSIISATEGGERLDVNDPWVLPSTVLGTGIDTFVRDFFSGTIGDLDTLSERYPNSTKYALKDFVKQLEQLKKDFDSRGLTIIPRDVTVTGVVEVTDKNNKKYKLNVAGTLDLLAYDKEGNFYIFDMKTHRSAVNNSKKTKWEKQLHLYAKFLESKYGISIKSKEIIPIKVSYPEPKGYKNSTNVYTEKDGQLYLNGNPYRVVPILQSNIALAPTNVEIDASKLTPKELGLLTLVEDSNTNTEKELKKQEFFNSNNDINKTGNISLAELQKRKEEGVTSTNAISIYNNRNYRNKVKTLLQSKGYTGSTRSEMIAFLENLNIPTTNIINIEDWISLIEECR